MRDGEIVVKAFAVLLNEACDAHLVWRGSDDTKTPSAFHRLLGGHVEFGESTVDAIRREVLEETSCRLIDVRLLGVLENRFVYRRRPGHEIVFVYTGQLSPPRPVPASGGWLSDNGDPIWVEWRSLATNSEQPPLYPEGVEAFVADAAGDRR